MTTVTHATTATPAREQALPTTGKGTCDKVLAALALIVLVPLFVLVAVAIRVDGRGPILFSQPRTGQHGRVFNILKFRTMIPQAGPAQATRHDSRVTRVGAFLRRTSLDELPQLINVLRGDMAIVGPRPHAVSHDAFYAARVANYMSRYSVKPGLTGWAQINDARGETETVARMARRVALDLDYIDNASPALDLAIMLRTPLALLRTDQAY